MDHADRDDRQGQADEQVGGDGEDVARLAQAAEIGDRDERDGDERDTDAVVVHGRDDGLDLGDRGRRRYRDRHDVVDEQRGRRDEAHDRCQIGLRDDVGPAAVGIGAADLAVGHGNDREQDRDRDRDLDTEEHRGGAGDQQDPQDLLGGVGGRGDGVRTEDGQRLAFRQAFADLLLAGQRAPEEDRPGPVEESTGRGQGDARGGLGHHLVRARVPEVR